MRFSIIFNVFDSMCFISSSVAVYHKYLLVNWFQTVDPKQSIILQRNSTFSSRSTEDAFSMVPAIPMSIRRFPVIVIQVSPCRIYFYLWIWTKLFLMAFCKWIEESWTWCFQGSICNDNLGKAIKSNWNYDEKINK